MEAVQEAASGECEENCTWLTTALEVLSLNDIEPATFAKHLYDLLKNGRGKYRNLMIVGRSNCTKTFMLKPLKLIFKCFENPSNDKFAWVGADKADVILMQDFRYSKEVIAWKDLLLLLEGKTVKLPVQKNHFVNDIIIDNDVPIFETSLAKNTCWGRYNLEDDQETEMMDARWSNSIMSLKKQRKKTDKSLCNLLCKTIKDNSFAAFTLSYTAVELCLRKTKEYLYTAQRKGLTEIPQYWCSYICCFGKH